MAVRNNYIYIIHNGAAITIIPENQCQSSLVEALLERWKAMVESVIDHKIRVLQSKIKELEWEHSITNKNLLRQLINERDKHLIELMRLKMEKNRTECKPWWRRLIGI
jgi:hypothetical protein